MILSGELKNKNCQPSVNTNGTFIRKYRDLCFEMECILYHCSENIDSNDALIFDNELDIEYLLIVTDNNFHRLEDFLNKDPDTTFNLVAATNPKGVDGPTLSAKNKHEMIKRFYKRMTKESIRRVFKEKNFDSIIYI